MAEIYFRFIRSTNRDSFKHMYSFGASNIILYVLLKDGGMAAWLDVYVPVIVGYVWCLLQLNPWILTAGLFAHLGRAHWNSLQTQYLKYNLDHTCVLMLMVTKLSSISFDLWDKRRLEEGKMSGKEREEEEARLQLVGIPSLIEFMGYAFLFPGFITGPAVLYPSYLAFIRGPQSTVQHPRRHHWASLQFIKAVWFGAAHLVLKSAFHHSAVLTRDFQTRSSAERLFYLHMAGMASRFMYYTAWLMAESSLVIMGFDINQVRIVNPLKIEFATNPRDILLNWNISTDRWLHRYFYHRLGRMLGSFGANIFVKFVSALWHGFYPGYYFTFISYGLLMAMSRALFRYTTWPLPQWSKPFILYIPMWAMIDYITTPFVLLSWSASVEFLNRTYWWTHMVCLATISGVYATRRGKEKQH